MTKANSKKKSPSKKKESTKKTSSRSKTQADVGTEAVASTPMEPTVETPVDTPPVEIAGKPTAPPEPIRPRTRGEILFQRYESAYRPMVGLVSAERPMAPPIDAARDPQTDAILFRDFRWKEEEAAFLRAEAERIAREKAEAERREAERIAREKAEAARLEAERIAREKAEAERLEAERIAKEKAEAERIAREKAEAERREAERIAREKAEAARLEAERIAAEQAEQKRRLEEQAKSELAAMAQQRAQAAASATVTYDQKREVPKPRQQDGMDKSIKILAGCIAAIFLLLIGVSASNMCKYTVREGKKGIDIYQGRFSPIGYQKLLSLPDIQPGCLKTNVVLSKAEVFPFICRYYLNKADLVIEQPGDLDIGKIKSLVREALPYAITDELKTAVHIRLNGLGQMADLYRADVLAEKGTPVSLQKAKDILTRAKAAAIGETNRKRIEAKLAEIESKISQ